MLFETIFVISFIILLSILFIIIGLLAQRKRITTGQEGMEGKTGIARTTINPKGGKAFVAGELWIAVSKDEIPSGSQVVVRAVRDMILVVEATQ